MPIDFTAPAALSRVPTAIDEQPRSQLEDDVLALFDQLRDPLLRYLSSFGIPVPDGEEIVQEAFLSLFQHLQRGRSRENLPGWLFRVAHNLALKLRYRDRRDFELRATTGGADLVMDSNPNPEERLVDAQNRRHLWAVVEALPEQDRRCLFLRAEGLRYRGIAEVLNISIGAVSLSLSRSLARLASAIERCKL